MSVAYNHRVAILGRTGSGKSHAARAIFTSAAAPRLVVDPNASALTKLSGAVTLPTAEVRRGLERDPSPGSAWQAMMAEHAETPTLRYVPADPYGLEEYEALYRWAFVHAPRFIWTDEAGIVSPATRPPRAFRRMLTQGRKMQVGHLACHTRPRELDPNIISQADHVLLFEMPHPDDRDHVSKLVGIPPVELRAALDALGEYEFLWFRVAAAELTHCPPMPKEAAA